MIEGLFSPVHLLVILVVALLVFGPHKLPEISRQVGKALREVRRVQTSFKDEVQGAFGEHPPVSFPTRSPLPAVEDQPVSPIAAPSAAAVPPTEASPSAPGPSSEAGTDPAESAGR